MLQQIWANLKRSWAHHAGLQVTTLTVLVAAYTLILSFLTVGQNLKSILSMWGDSIQMSVYVKNDISPEGVAELGKELQKIEGVTDVKFVSKVEAAEKFKIDMSGFMPEMLADSDFSAPFPASFIIKLGDKLKQKVDSKKLGQIAKQISLIEGTEDISYGQDWVQNYATFVGGVNTLGLIFVSVLLSASIFVIGNAVKTSVFVRKEEIEILELFGASKNYIRAPYVIEGALLGLGASLIAITITSVAFGAIRESISVQTIFLSVKTQFKFLSVYWVFLFMLAGTVFGGLSAYFFVRQLNHGWLASQRTDF